MRPHHSAPSIVPTFDVDVHIVLDDLGKSGRVYREIDEEDARLEQIVDDLLSGRFQNPMRVIAFNTAEGWSRDVSEDVGWDCLRRAMKEGKRLPASTRTFVDFHIGEEEVLRAEAGLV